MTINKITTEPRDAELTLRVNNDATHSTTTLKWHDLSAGYPSGNLDGTKFVPTKASTVILDITASTNATSSDTFAIQLLLTNTEDPANPGQGDTSDLAHTITLRTFGEASANAHASRYKFPVSNVWNGVAYRFVGYRMLFAGSGSAKWGAYVAAGHFTGIA